MLCGAHNYQHYYALFLVSNMRNVYRKVSQEHDNMRNKHKERKLTAFMQIICGFRLPGKLGILNTISVNDGKPISNS